MALPCVKGAIAGHGADLCGRLGLSPLSPEVNSAARMSPVAVSIASMRRIRKQSGYEQDPMPCDCVFPTIDLAILASALRAMLARMPFPIPGNSDPPSPVRPNRWRFAGSMSTNRSSGPGAWRLDTRTVIRFWRRRWTAEADHCDLLWGRATSCPCPARSAEIRATSAHHCRTSRSSSGNGQLRARSCEKPDHMDPPEEARSSANSAKTPTPSFSQITSSPAPAELLISGHDNSPSRKETKDSGAPMRHLY